MIKFLTAIAVVALAVVIVNLWNSDSADQRKKEAALKDGEHGCVWLLVALGGIVLVWIITKLTS